jgi:very-short-patch-repair endonuclease
LITFKKTPLLNTIIPYRKDLKLKARELRKNMTPAEKVLWAAIRRKSLGVEFHRQVPMLDYIVDFYCHEIGLVLEVDGGYHNNQVLKDGIRQGRLEEKGVHFLRFTNEEVLSDMENVLATISERIKECV